MSTICNEYKAMQYFTFDFVNSKFKNKALKLMKKNRNSYSVIPTKSSDNL